MITRSKPNPILTVLLLVLVGFLLVVGYVVLTATEQMVYHVPVAKHDTLPGMPVFIEPETRAIHITLLSRLIHGEEVVVPHIEFPPAGCATTFIAAGQFVRTDMVTDCADFATVVVPLDPRANPVTWAAGMPAWYCVVSVGPGRRADWCEECFRIPEVITRTLDAWTVGHVISPTGYMLLDGIVCVGGYLGNPLTERGWIARPCPPGEQAGATVVGGNPAITTAGAPLRAPVVDQPQETFCTDDPPVAREIVIRLRALPALALMEHLEGTTSSFLAVGAVPIPDSGVIFLGDTWYALPHGAPGDTRAPELPAPETPPVPPDVSDPGAIITPLPPTTPTVALTPSAVLTPEVTLTPTATLTPTVPVRPGPTPTEVTPVPTPKGVIPPAIPQPD